MDGDEEGEINGSDLYLEDDEFTGPFAKLKSSDAVTIAVEAVLASSGTIPNFGNMSKAIQLSGSGRHADPGLMK